MDCLRVEKMIPGCPGFQKYLKSELSIQKPGNFSEASHFKMLVTMERMQILLGEINLKKQQPMHFAKLILLVLA